MPQKTATNREEEHDVFFDENSGRPSSQKSSDEPKGKDCSTDTSIRNSDAKQNKVKRKTTMLRKNFR